MKKRPAPMKRAPFRRILLPTDGSRAAAKGTKTGIALARSLGARVEALYVAREQTSLQLGAAALHGARDVLEEVERRPTEQAKKALAAAQRAAKAAGVACTVGTVVDNKPWRAILRVARQRKCDLIVIGTRGGNRLASVLFGGETARVLSASKIPVLVLP